MSGELISCYDGERCLSQRDTDVVYSNGVCITTPDTAGAIGELHRVKTRRDGKGDDLSQESSLLGS